MKNVFTSDLHGNKKKFELLFNIIKNEKPDGVFIGGDILPNTYALTESVLDFLSNYLFNPLKSVREETAKDIRCFIILGNDDPKINEKVLLQKDEEKIIDYVHFKTIPFENFFVTGYSFIPPSPFQLKDWEKYDVSRYVDINSISPEEGIRSIYVKNDEVKFSTISEDLQKLVHNAPPEKTIFLFHSPPYNTNLDRAALDGKQIDHTPLDVHIGSIAIQRFIEKYHPLITLHGHVHETVSLTGNWKEVIGNTYAFTGAHEEYEFNYIIFDPSDLPKASRKRILL